MSSFGHSEPHPKGVPITPHYLSLYLALDITLMADSDSILYCQSVQKVCSACAVNRGGKRACLGDTEQAILGHGTHVWM